MESYSLYELNEYIKRVIALNFAEPLWIEAELLQANERKGHVFVELGQKAEDKDQLIAQSSAAIWYRDFQFIKRKIGAPLVSQLLQPGTQIKLKCEVAFNERYGLKLIIKDLDPSFTYGQIELNKQKILARIEAEGLAARNKQRHLPMMPQRIAVLSSPKAAGYHDFINQLAHNSYGYHFETSLFPVAVQGHLVKNEVCRALQTIAEEHIQDYDAIVIIRGGGSKLDLSGFDDYDIAKAIAQSPLPCLVGIGHEIDSGIADMVAHSSLKTPTAVADFLIECGVKLESKLYQLSQEIADIAQQRITAANHHIQQLRYQLTNTVQTVIYQQHLALQQKSNSLRHAAIQYCQQEQHRLNLLRAQLQANDPTEIMQKGYSYVTKDGHGLTGQASLSQGDEITIHFIDGTRDAEIKS